MKFPVVKIKSKFANSQISRISRRETSPSRIFTQFHANFTDGIGRTLCHASMLFVCNVSFDVSTTPISVNSAKYDHNFPKKMTPIRFFGYGLWPMAYGMVVSAKIQVGVRAKKANHKISEETYLASLDTPNCILTCVLLINQISIIVKRNQGV